MDVIRAVEDWQRVGSFYVRTLVMAEKHHITLRQEFDEHDTQETKYILALDNNFPVATARMYQLDSKSVMIGRVVVLSEYRHQGIGRRVLCECEKWARELGYQRATIESRDNKIPFYRQIGYKESGDPLIEGETFRCVRMEKVLID